MTHRHVTDEEGVPQKCVEIDPRICLTPVAHRIDAGPSLAEQHLAGFIVQFDQAGNEFRGMGEVNVDPHFDVDRPRWLMTGSLEGGDLSLAPSIRIAALGLGELLHGYVTNGKWVPA